MEALESENMSDSLELYEPVAPLFAPVTSGTRNPEQGMLNLGIELVRSRSDGLLRVKKIIPSNRAQQEVDALLCLRDHPFVNKLIQFDTMRVGVELAVVLFLEYCDCGSLQGVIRRSITERRQRLPEAFIWHVFKSMAKALAYLHYGINEFNPSHEDERNWNFVLHRDLKPHNIFLKTESDARKPYPRVILGDFGASTCRSNLQERRLLRRYPSIMTLAYTPPEAPRYDRKSDVWALAASIQDMMGVERYAGTQMILEPSLRNSGYSTELIRCVTAARRVNHRDRLSAPELVVALSGQYRNVVRHGGISPRPEPLEPWRLSDDSGLVSAGRSDGRR